MDNETNIPAEVRAFLEGILQEAGMSFPDETMKDSMIKELFNRLDSFLTANIVDNLKPEDVEQFIKLNEEKRPQAEIETYLRDKIPNVDGMFAKVFADFRDMYLGNVNKARTQAATPAIPI